MLEGERYSYLTVIRYVGTSNNRAKFRMYEFRCDCGTKIVLAGSEVRRAIRRSCGCMRKPNNTNRTHGYRYTKIYKAWVSMRGRCLRSSHRWYGRYGGRGIKVCKRWGKFENFLKDMGEPPSPKHSLERIDNNLGYNKLNCKWATQAEQNRNSSNNIYYTMDGETKCLAEWASKFQIPYRLLWERVRRSGWGIREALSFVKRNLKKA